MVSTALPSPASLLPWRRVGRENIPRGVSGCPRIYGVAPAWYAWHGGDANLGMTPQLGASLEVMRAGLRPKQVVLLQKSL